MTYLNKLKVTSLILFHVTLLLVYCLSSLRADEMRKYAGSKRSDKYHYLSCKSVRQIQPKNIIYFSTVNEAIEAGYVPCRVCKPPVKDGDE